jgi:RNA polymerase sigma factor
MKILPDVGRECKILIIETEKIDKSSDLDSRAVAAKHSEDEMERLISDFKPFLYSRAAKYVPKYDEFQHDELYSTAMIAFYEAIQGYDIEKGHFFPFASRVIRYNIIDHIRKIYRHEGREVPIDKDDNDDDAPTAAIEKISVRIYEDNRRRERIADEIEQLKAELAQWGIPLETLVKQSPKHKKLCETYRTLTAQILSSPDIVQTIQLKHYFPIKAISEISGLPQKKLERARTFILASLLIKLGDYDILSDYVNGEVV